MADTRACTLSAGPASLTLDVGPAPSCRHTGLRLQPRWCALGRQPPMPATDVSGRGTPPRRHLLSPRPETGTPPQAKARVWWVGLLPSVIRTLRRGDGA